ncbi:GNAT family N-acetyltransferase [Nannocystis radixulma]|uniref:GNAT family N-acetyltransferase n=1 Tax=Nannocystis radixulma TaxID=2995305 RepID=A0ABT5B1K8_9BACT|nr:GNAT family N-acetyltransferase [Nannocystis radixulma]MDC0667962.1 GNAT family N-acetyltransferase [Nannocystis radixulma]
MSTNAGSQPPRLHELPASAYHRIWPSLRALARNTLFARAVAEQGAPGQVFAYPAESPAVVYVIHDYGMSLLYGSTGLAGVDEQLLAEVVRRPRSAAEWLQVAPAVWAERLQGRAVERYTRVNFRFSPQAYAVCRPSPAAPEVRIVRADRTAFAMPGSVVPRLFWRDAEWFLAAGGGFGAIVDGELASLAFVSFVGDTGLELGIETLPHHRGRGLARLACAALIDECLARGREPVWACRLENTASHRLAESLGFTAAHHFPYFRLPPTAC